MKKVQYYLVDVFAERKYEGNPLAVFIDSEHLTDEEMLSIAREINYSEVSFLSSVKKNESFRVRIFTPEGEIPFAGHPSLGTAFVIKENIIRENLGIINLDLPVGNVSVSIDNREVENPLYWVNQLYPKFSDYLDATRICQVLSIELDDLDTRYPIQEVSTGLPTVIVPLKNLKSLTQCRINKEKYFSLVEQLDAKLIHVFCPETYVRENQLNVRNFGDYYGVSEEPATGSANGCLAGYLVKHNYFGNKKLDIRVEQGREINRLGHIYLKAKKTGKTINVLVGGRVLNIGKGELYL